MIRKGPKTAGNALREKAEARFARAGPAEPSALSPEALLHELQVHQVELELQNEELQRAQVALEISRDRYLDLYDFAPDGYLGIDDTGLIAEANLTSSALLGIDRAVLYGRPLTAFLSPADADRWRGLHAALRRKPAQPLECNLQVRRRDGSVFTGHLAMTRRPADGPAPRTRVTLTDVSERSLAEARLAAAETKYRSMVTALAEGVVLQDARGGIVECNGAAERILGLSLSQLEGRTSVDPRWRTIREDGTPLPGDQHPGLVALRTGAPLRDVVMGIQRPDGGVSWLSVNAEPLRSATDARPHAVVCSFQEITGQRLQGERLRRSEEQARRLVEAAPVPIAYFHGETGALDINPKFTEVLGYVAEDVPTLEAWFQRAYPEKAYRRQVAEGWARGVEEAAKAGRGVPSAEYRVTGKDGVVRIMLISGVALGEDQVAVLVDVTARHQAEEALADAHRLAQETIDAIPEHLCVVDRHGMVVAVNRAWRTFARLNGAPDGADFVGSSYLEACARAAGPGSEQAGVFLAELGDVLAGRSETFSLEYPCHAPDQERWFLAQASRFDAGVEQRVVISHTDITHRVEGEAQRAELMTRSVRAERGAALGTLAAGMAHEINNPLTPVLAGIDFVMGQLKALPEPCLAAWRTSGEGSLADVQGALEDAAQGARRVRDLVADLRSFALGQHATDSTCDLTSAMERAVRVAHHALGDRTTLSVELPALPQVSGSESELIQLFACLLVNAEQATGERANRVMVSATLPGAAVEVRVTDTGKGITPEHMPRIFEPFFTTRSVGQGKGLGLPVAQGIAQGLGGSIEVQSVLGQGTTVIVTLPVGAPNTAVATPL